ncbi:hypothetical protein NC653_031952 [Populus alba x Populus x berolinensis]|uniref:Uncharacterized protein n=1 Tax=Populus alba x Populus x berolinensis TaxID=444605 RepID=A0AAD6Q295_9ROSI|nr:hypothetical protein NC653_031952 [Populus alba x Populus x berolinensis]
MPTHSNTACKRVISLEREPHPNEFLPSMKKVAKGSRHKLSPAG